MNKNKEVYVWCCDFSNYRGEGILARLFVEHLAIYYNKIIINTFKKKYFFFKSKKNIESKRNLKKKINLNFFEKYICPFIGILWLWKMFFQKRKIVYLNFNPLWNIFIFIFSPPGTLFGPITGSIFRGNPTNMSQIIRKYCFPFLYKISLFFLFLRKKKILFSTSLLKKIIPKKKYKKCIFNFQIQYYNKIFKNQKFNKKRNIDFIYYNRNHISKKNRFLKKTLNEIAKNFKVSIVGHFLKNKNFYNYNLISKNKLNKIIANSKFTFAAPENIFSMFTLECLSLGTKIFFHKEHKEINNFFTSKNLIPVNFNDTKQMIKIVNKNLNEKYKSNTIFLNVAFWKKQNDEVKKFFLNF